MGSAQNATHVNVSGIVVDYGDGRRSYAIVPFAGDTISGAELLRRSGLSLLTVEFGGMGEGICAIEDTGCDLSACRARLCQTGDPDSPFWQYLRAGEDGSWQPAPLGASTSEVGNGDVDGWFWTGTTPRSDAVTLKDVASETGVDLAAIATAPDNDFESIVVTTGANPEAAGVELANILAGIGIVAAITALGGWLILRARRGTT